MVGGPCSRAPLWRARCAGDTGEPGVLECVPRTPRAPRLPCEHPRANPADARRRYWCMHVPPHSDGLMRTSPAVRPTPSPTLWLARGRHSGPDADDVVRRTLHRLKDEGTIDDHLEVAVSEASAST